MHIAKHVSLTVSPDDGAVIKEGCIDGQLSIYESGRSVHVDFGGLSDKQYEQAALALLRISEGMLRRLGKSSSVSENSDF